ncbi:DUF7693 family protein [Pseudomonas sp. OTU5201]|uniref:DUF7693 family protein n=1 Tax=Pseudomonas sp. OTU5201 TaxID=3043850 RepID=UPI00406CE42C
MNTSRPQLSGHEVAQLLRDALLGKVEVRLATPGMTWRGAYCGIVEFRIEGWLVAFFNDCASLDYCEYAHAPDGRAGTFESWDEAGEEPIALLTDAEQFALATLLDAIE